MGSILTLIFLGLLGTCIYYLFKKTGFLDYYLKQNASNYPSDSDTKLKFKEIELKFDAIDSDLENIKKKQTKFDENQKNV